MWYQQLAHFSVQSIIVDKYVQSQTIIISFSGDSRQQQLNNNFSQCAWRCSAAHHHLHLAPLLLLLLVLQKEQENARCISFPQAHGWLSPVWVGFLMQFVLHTAKLILRVCVHVSKNAFGCEWMETNDCVCFAEIPLYYGWQESTRGSPSLEVSTKHVGPKSWECVDYVLSSS